jgi:hypothetical protein
MKAISLQKQANAIERKFLARVSSKITHYQENDRWVAGIAPDPNDVGNDITDTPRADTTGPVWDQAMIDVLRETRGYHRQAVRAINSYIARAKANAGITLPSDVAQKFNRRY